jgi:hypothetical protein
LALFTTATPRAFTNGKSFSLIFIHPLQASPLVSDPEAQFAKEFPLNAWPWFHVCRASPRLFLQEKNSEDLKSGQESFTLKLLNFVSGGMKFTGPRGTSQVLSGPGLFLPLASHSSFPVGSSNQQLAHE